jgi:hypothetical protein
MMLKMSISILRAIKPVAYVCGENIRYFASQRDCLARAKTLLLNASLVVIGWFGVWPPKRN